MGFNCELLFDFIYVPIIIRSLFLSLRSISLQHYSIASPPITWGTVDCSRSFFLFSQLQKAQRKYQQTSNSISSCYCLYLLELSLFLSARFSKLICIHEKRKQTICKLHFSSGAFSCSFSLILALVVIQIVSSFHFSYFCFSVFFLYKYLYSLVSI